MTTNDTSKPSATIRAAVRGWGLVGISAATVLGLRVWILTLADVPRIMPDEIGSWAIGRFVAGLPNGIAMRAQPLYPVGPGILLAPLTRFGGPIQQYRTFGLMSAALLAAAAAALVHAVSRLQPLRSNERLAATTLGAAMPAVFFTSAFSWSEFVIPLYWAALVAICLGFRSTTNRFLIASAMVAGCAPLIHGRFLPVPVVWLATQALLAVVDLRRSRKATAARRGFAGAIGVAVVASSLWLDQFITSRIWTEPSSIRSDWTSGLDDLFFYKSLALVLGGTLWYMVTSTFGLAGIGAAALVIRARRDAVVRPGIAVLGTLLATNLAVSCVYFAGWFTRSNLRNQRIDHLFYGRYVDGATWVLFIVGCVTVLSGLPRWLRGRGAVISLVGFAGLGVLITVVVDEVSQRFPLQPFFGPTTSGVWALPFEQGTHDIARWSLVGILGLTCILILGRRNASVRAGVLLCIVLPVTTLAALNVRSTHDRWGYAATYINVPPPVSNADVVYVAEDVEPARGYRLILFAQQYQLVSRGWSFAFDQGDSAELLNDPPLDAGLLVTLRDASGYEVLGTVGPAALVVPPRDDP